MFIVDGKSELDLSTVSLSTVPVRLEFGSPRLQGHRDGLINQRLVMRPTPTEHHTLGHRLLLRGVSESRERKVARALL